MAKSVINPYNFVPFGKEPKRENYDDFYKNSSDLLTGYLDISIKNTTPLIIPDAYHVQENHKGHKKYNFFKLKDSNGVDHYAIPGSEIRGVIRSIYEAITNSCVNNTPTDSPISQRTPLYASFQKRGLLEYNKSNSTWTLYEAKAYKNRTKGYDVKKLYLNRYANGDKVFFVSDECIPFKIVEKDEISNYNCKEGYLQFNTPLDTNKKYGYALLSSKMKEGKQITRWSKDDNTILKTIFSAITDKENNKSYPVESKINKQLKEKFEYISKNGGVIPVYFTPFKKEDISDLKVYLYSHVTVDKERCQKRGLLRFDKNKNEWQLFYARVHINIEKEFNIEGTYKNHKAGEKVVYSSDENIPFTILEKNQISNYNYKEGYLQFNTPVNKSGPYHYTVLAKKDRVIKSWKNKDKEEKGERPEALFNSALDRDGVPNKNLPKTEQNDQLKIKLTKISKNGGIIPVFYECCKINANDSDKDNDKDKDIKIYLSPAACGRIGREKKWDEIYGNYSPCKSVDKLCPACLLFGVTLKGESDISGSKGRLRFSDAICEDDCSNVYNKTLPILGGPKPSAFEFYLNRPQDAIFWNFDYYVKQVNEDDFSFNEYFNNDGIIPRGRKFYYHHEVLDKEKTEGSGNNETKMNSTVEVLESNNTFKSRIYFDDITKKQLSELIWCLTFGDNLQNQDNYQHKIGHGKPLGYGSVKFRINECMVRNISIENGKICYTENKHQLDEFDFDDSQYDEAIKKSILAMSDTTKINKYKEQKATVEYPFAYDKKGQKVIYKWFADNRRTSEVKTLPYVLDDDITLKIIEPKNKFGNDQKNERASSKNHNYKSKQHNTKHKTY